MKELPENSNLKIFSQTYLKLDSPISQTNTHKSSPFSVNIISKRQTPAFIFAILSSICQGILIPIYFLFDKSDVDLFSVESTDDQKEALFNYLLYLSLGICFLVFIFSFLGSFCWNWLSRPFTENIKRK